MKPHTGPDESNAACHQSIRESKTQDMTCTGMKQPCEHIHFNSKFNTLCKIQLAKLREQNHWRMGKIRSRTGKYQANQSLFCGHLHSGQSFGSKSPPHSSQRSSSFRWDLAMMTSTCLASTMQRTRKTCKNAALSNRYMQKNKCHSHSAASLGWIPTANIPNAAMALWGTTEIHCRSAHTLKTWTYKRFMVADVGQRWQLISGR